MLAMVLYDDRDYIAVKVHTIQHLALVSEVRGQMDFNAFLDNDSDAKKRR